MYEGTVLNVQKVIEVKDEKEWGVPPHSPPTGEVTSREGKRKETENRVEIKVFLKKKSKRKKSMRNAKLCEKSIKE